MDVKHFCLWNYWCLVLFVVGGKYNSLMERYKRLVAKCVEECAPRYDGLKKKYTDECAERCRLYNELIELRGNIRVSYRCRPLSADEVSRGCSPVFESDPSQETELQFVPSERERNIFKFDRVFRPGDDQGINCCYFACHYVHNVLFGKLKK